MENFFWFVLSLSIVMGLTYLVGKTALDNSKMAEELRTIRQLLQKQQQGTGETEEPQEKIEILDIPFDACPACGAKVRSADRACPECGLTLNQ